jgi:hypothetical protein
LVRKICRSWNAELDQWRGVGIGGFGSTFSSNSLIDEEEEEEEEKEDIMAAQLSKGRKLTHKI